HGLGLTSQFCQFISWKAVFAKLGQSKIESDGRSACSAKARGGALRRFHLDECQRTTALNSPSYQAAYKPAHDRQGRSHLTTAREEGMTMNRKIAAVLLAATMLSAPAFAASVASSATKSATQTVNPDKVTKTSAQGVKKHRAHARSSHGHKIHHVKHAKQKQMKHVKKVSKKSVTSATTNGNAKTVTAAPAKAPVKN